MPLMDYGSVIGGSTSSSNLERLLKLEKRAARIILTRKDMTQSVISIDSIILNSISTDSSAGKA